MVFIKGRRIFAKQKGVQSHANPFQQNSVCYVSASVLHQIFDFQLT
jgi:hypothetical protein